MNKHILIIEDEVPAANRLVSMVKQYRPEWTVLEVLDTIEQAVLYILEHDIDLIFMDIQLADGLSFDIFNQVEVTCPVIFATAYNDYALKAFEVNGFDYLLKPLTEEAFKRALLKFEKYNSSTPTDFSQLVSIMENRVSPDYKSRFLIKTGEQLKFVQVEDIAYFVHDGGYTEIVSHSNDKFLIDDSIESICSILNPDEFFQINRKCIVHISSIDKIHQYFNSRLKLELRPKIDAKLIVSRDRVKGFKAFLSK